MRTVALHPAQRFVAPMSIQTGVPLKTLMNATLVTLLGESLATVVPAFDNRRFRRTALDGLDDLEFLPRAAHIAAALDAALPRDRDAAADLMIAALGPELSGTKGLGLAPFFYLPHVAWIRSYATDNFAAGMRANLAVTKRFSAEFSVRPFLLRYTKPSLRLLAQWSKDANPHVRRLVSEGTRPRLPWAERLPPFIRDPSPTVRLLERLKDDPSEYVRRSVANHLGDIAKDHPAVAYAVCRRWLDEVATAAAPRAAARRGMVRHAVRLPARKGDLMAVRLRRDAGGR